MGKLDGKVAVITGGASGIGAAAVRLFVEEGCRVVIADVQDDKGARLADELGKSCAYLHADVSRESDVSGAIAHALSRFGRLDCLYNNAGLGGVSGPIEEIPVDGYDQTMGVLLRGVFLGMKHAAPIMKRQGSGSIVSTASVAGLQAGYGPHIYSAAKAAVVHLTRSVAMELGESGVRVNCICPGGIATPIFGAGRRRLRGGGGPGRRDDEDAPGGAPADPACRPPGRHRAGRALAGQRRFELRERPRPHRGRRPHRRPHVVGGPGAGGDSYAPSWASEPICEEAPSAARSAREHASLRPRALAASLGRIVGSRMSAPARAVSPMWRLPPGRVSRRCGGSR